MQHITEVERLQAIVDALLYTKDRVRPVSAMTVYGISPWGGIETLYVEDNLCWASTCFPTETSGAGECKFPITICYAKEEAEGFLDRWRYNGDL